MGQVSGNQTGDGQMEKEPGDCSHVCSRLQAGAYEISDCGLKHRTEDPSTGLRTIERHHLLDCAHVRRAFLTCITVAERG